jgi:hypothetical protein
VCTSGKWTTPSAGCAFVTGVGQGSKASEERAPHHLGRSVLDVEYTIQQSKRDRRDREEIHDYDRFTMVQQKMPANCYQVAPPTPQTGHSVQRRARKPRSRVSLGRHESSAPRLGFCFAKRGTKCRRKRLRLTCSLSSRPKAIRSRPMRQICSERDRLWAEYNAAINSYFAAVKRYAALGGITQVSRVRGEVDDSRAAIRQHCSKHGCDPEILKLFTR